MFKYLQINTFILILLIASPTFAHQETLQVINITGPASVETISPNGKRQRLQLAGIKTVLLPNQIKSTSRQRLRTLIQGKTVQIDLVDSSNALIYYGGLNIATRLLSEGLAIIDEQTMPRLNMALQQQFITATEQARQYRRGIWQQQRSTIQQRFHYPLWPAERLPSPITNAPVYKPDTK